MDGWITQRNHAARIALASPFCGRESLDMVLDGLEEWLYSEEAETADLSELKAKRQKVIMHDWSCQSFGELHRGDGDWLAGIKALWYG